MLQLNTHNGHQCLWKALKEAANSRSPWYSVSERSFKNSQVSLGARSQLHFDDSVSRKPFSQWWCEEEDDSQNLFQFRAIPAHPRVEDILKILPTIAWSQHWSIWCIYESKSLQSLYFLANSSFTMSSKVPALNCVLLKWSLHSQFIVKLIGWCNGGFIPFFFVLFYCGLWFH